MTKRFLAFVMFALAASNAYCATGTLVVYDDADKNGFDHNSAFCSGTAIFNETTVVHSGTAAIAFDRTDNNGAGWQTPSVYSTASDYDGVSFWVNAGNSPTTTTSLAIYDAQDTGHFLHLEDIYGGPLPANTWVSFQIPFSSPYFTMAASTPPETMQTLCIVNHSAGGMGTFMFLDDVSLTGADIFKNGFEN